MVPLWGRSESSLSSVSPGLPSLASMTWCQARCLGPCYKSGALFGDPLLLYKDLNAAENRLLYIFISVFNVSGDSVPGATAGSGFL